MDKKHKSFRISSFESTNKEKRKWYQFTKMDRRELGYTAVVGILAGGIFSQSGYLIGEVLGDLLAIIGLASTVMWIYKVIRQE